MKIIGRTTVADLPAEGITGIPVKVDTGADSSAIWASEIHMNDQYELAFVLFAKGSPYYSGKPHKTKTYAVKVVRSAHGSRQIRYKVMLSIVIAGRRVKGTFTLADRSANTYPVLIGCKLLSKKFLVDPAKGDMKLDKPKNSYNKEMRADPKAFFEKYHSINTRGDIAL